MRKFSGDPKKQQTVIGSSNSTVHALTPVSDVRKFSYLQGYLEGDTLASISGLALSLQNYTEAMDLLRKRYGNPHVIFFEY